MNDQEVLESTSPTSNSLGSGSSSTGNSSPGSVAGVGPLEKMMQQLEVENERFANSESRPPRPMLLRPPGKAWKTPDKQSLLEGRLQGEEMRKRANYNLRTLVEKTGMPVTQENGQRRYGPPRNYSGPTPIKGSEVFIGKIPRDAMEPELVPLFESVGKIYELRIMMDFTGANRGYGFVQFYKPEDAKNAILYLNNFEIRKGHFIGVVKSLDNCRLYVGGIPKEKTKSEIYQEMNRITDGVVRVIVYQISGDKSKNRGFAFIEYENHKAAAMARRKMLPGKIPMWGVEVTVDWARPEPEAEDGVLPKDESPKYLYPSSKLTHEKLAVGFPRHGGIVYPNPVSGEDHGNHATESEHPYEGEAGCQLTPFCTPFPVQYDFLLEPHDPVLFETPSQYYGLETDDLDVQQLVGQFLW